MEFLTKTATFDQYKTDCAIVFVSPKTRLNEQDQAVDSLTDGALSNAIRQGDLKKDAGSCAWFYPNSKKLGRVLAVSRGSSATVSPAEAQKALIQAAKTLATKPATNATLHLDGLAVKDQGCDWQAQQVATLFTREAYRYTETKPKHDPLPALKKLTISHANKAELGALKKGTQYGQALGDGINLTRELGNLPGNVCTPTYLATQAKALAKGNTKFSAKIVEQAEMKKMGMGSLLSVSIGSDQPPKLIVMEYKGKASKSPNVLVGKGITFDTGGISLKPGAGMDEMKYDMCGAASVFGTLKALADMKAPVHVVGIVAAAENMPSGRATKPGDVVTSMSGQTIEVLNTDAEGRLVLCDALTYAERFKPKSVVDIATLTGACVIALGSHATGLYANKQALADALISAGEKTDDRAWQMPLWDNYKKQLKSNFADLANIGGREAGSVTAACFLAHFTESYPWAHLDIAGTAWNSGANKGATGRPVALLVDYLLNNA